MRQEHLSGGTCSTGATATGTRSNALWGKGRRRYPAARLHVRRRRGLRRLRDRPRPARPRRRPVSCPTAFGTRPRRTRRTRSTSSSRRPMRSQLDALGATVRDAQKKHPGKAKGLTEEVQADRQRDGGAHRRPDLRHRRGAGRRQRDRGCADPGDLLRQPAELARERRRPVGRPTEKGGVPHDRDRRLGRRAARRLRQTAHPPGRLHDHGRELLGRRLRARDARRRPRRRRCRPLHGRRAASEHRVARRPRRRRQRDGEQPPGRLRLDPPEQALVQHRCRQLLAERRRAAWECRTIRSTGRSRSCG